MSTNNNLTDYKLPQNAYVAFDALNLKEFIISRLKESGNFSDQIYDGSNLSSIIEIIAYSYHVLMFYLNTTASESTFSQASLYENMNKIISLVGYKPTGRQTSTCTIKAIADNTLPIGNYTLRKYSYILVNDIPYTFIKNYGFSKTTNEAESLQVLDENVILYQGSVNEYPVYTSSGDSFETLPIVIDNVIDDQDTRFISAGTISVYVKEKKSNKFYEYKETGNLYLDNGYDRVYDLRLNENGHYEVKFGDGTFGKKLSEGDEVYVFYLLSDNRAGLISKNSLGGRKIFIYSTNVYEQIFADVYSDILYSIITSANTNSLSIDNQVESSPISEQENVDQIKTNTPLFVASNLKLTTTNDYTYHLNKTLGTSVQSIYVATNKEFIEEYIRYFYEISVDPNKVNRVILNQVNFADSTDFNNVNVFTVPYFSVREDNKIPQYTPNAIKNLILDATEDIKTIGHEIVPRDPIFTILKIGTSNLTPSVVTPDSCKLRVVRERNNKIKKESIQLKVAQTILDFLEPRNNSLGQLLRLTDLTSNILNIPGVKKLYTSNDAESIISEGVSFIGWNPLYPDDDIIVIDRNTKLPFFKFPYLGYPQTLINYIDVIDE